MKKILIVDDEPDVLKMIAFRVKKAGYEIATAFDGEKALEAVSKDRPDLILLDLRLPRIDGWEVCRRLKADEKFSSIPIVILSASVSSLNSDKTKELEAEDYLLKPFEPVVLLEKIKNLIGP
jgi:DNA-binding response OmpR family regulator